MTTTSTCPHPWFDVWVYMDHFWGFVQCFRCGDYYIVRTPRAEGRKETR